MSARDQGAMTRAAIQSALVATEAMARVEALEAKVAALARALSAVGQLAGVPELTAAAEEIMRPDLRVVR